MKKLRWLRSNFFIGLLLIFASLATYRYANIERIENFAFDLYQQWSPRAPAHDMPVRPVIIDIDEAALEAYGQWPWPRTLLAKLVDNLREYGVLVTGFDIVFAEEDRTSPALMGATIPELDATTRKTLATLPNHDDIFAESIRKGGVVLGQVGEFKPVTTERIKPKLASIGEKKTSKDALSLDQMLLHFPGAIPNIAKLNDAAAGIGLFSIIPDRDGVYRKVTMLDAINTTDGKPVIFPSLTLEMLRVAMGGGDTIFVTMTERGIKAITLKIAGGGKFEIPTDSKGRIWVHYANYPTSKPPLYISAKAVLEKTADRKLLENTMAIVGTSAVGLKDIRVTPVNPALPGVEVHAQVLETILSQSYLKRESAEFGSVRNTSVTVQMVELLTILLGGLLILFGINRSALIIFVLSTLVGLSITKLGWYYYTTHHVLVNWLYPALSLFMIFMVLTYLNYMREEKQRKQIRHAFGHYVSPALLQELADNPDKLVLGGETRHLTILFSDIRGFTTIAERFNAQELTRFINRFLTPMTNVILSNKGTVDKYMGDAVMAFWNAPLDDADHPKNACRAALAMQKAVKELNKTLAEEAEQVKLQPGPNGETRNRRRSVPIQIGVGINSGQCCVGNMGSDQRFDYSALGDDVNLASRLEGQSKTYGVDIVLGENTVKEIGDSFAIIELDLLQVKGKTQPVRVHALLGDETMLGDETFQKVKACMAELLVAYRAQDWDETDRKAKELSALHRPLTELARLYLERTREYRETPPPEGWNGAYIATSK